MLSVLQLVLVAFAMLLPGGVLALIWAPCRREGLMYLTFVGLLSGAFWMVSFWWLRWLPVGLEAWVYFSLGGWVLLAWLARRRLFLEWKALQWPKGGVGVLTWVGIGALFAVRLYPAWASPAAPGADMSMHGYMSWLILAADGVPVSHRPLLPIDDFGAYAAGLPTLGAFFSALSGISIPKASLLFACLSHFILTGALYALFRRRVSPVAASIAALTVTMVSTDPQLHFFWGGNPTVLALCMLVGGWACLEALMDESLRALIPAALLLAGSLVAHSVLPLGFAFLLIPLGVLKLWPLSWRLRREKVGQLIAMGAVAVALLLPYLLYFHVQLTPDELAWIRDWQRLPAHLPGGSLWLFPLRMVKHIGPRLGWFTLAAMLASVGYLAWRRRAPFADDILVFVGILLLAMNARLWWLPASYALYPDRLFLMLTVPIGRFIAVALEDLLSRGFNRRAGVAMAFIALALGVYQMKQNYLDGLREVSVTAEDLVAFEWLENHLAPGEVIANNYGDAGIWIPAFLGKPVQNPHVNIVYMDDVRRWQTDIKPRYVFVGAKTVYSQGNNFTLKEMTEKPDLYRLVFQQGKAAVFEVISAP